MLYGGGKGRGPPYALDCLGCTLFLASAKLTNHAAFRRFVFFCDKSWSTGGKPYTFDGGPCMSTIRGKRTRQPHGGLGGDYRSTPTSERDAVNDVHQAETPGSNSGLTCRPGRPQG